MLLRLRVANHRSIRDEVELSLTTGGFKGNAPPDHDWPAVVNRVTAIYGPNGSGKSTILEVLGFIREAVRNSATAWSDRETFPFEPFELDETSRESPSLYEIDIVDRGVRYTYGFESNSRRIVSEWLSSYPSGRRRTLFERNGQEVRAGRSLGGETALFSKMTEPTQLYLSVGALAKHKLLSRLRHAILHHILYARFDHKDQTSRINWVMGKLATDEALLKSTQAIAGLADLGVSTLTVGSRSISEEEKSEIRSRLRKTLEASGVEISDSELESALESAQRYIELTHNSTHLSGPGKALPFTAESSGTVAWLSLIVPALHAIKCGLVLLIDELDSSLHPKLSATIVELFNDLTLNKAGGQLIFTSHDTSLLGNNLQNSLRKDQVWFTEKDANGATSVYALDEFTIRSTDNVEKRYLEGRYGALPVIDLEGLRKSLAEAL